MVVSRIELDKVADQLAELVEEVGRGGEIVITKDEQPVAKLIGYQEVRRTPRFGSAKGLITIAEDFDAPLEDFDEYMR